MIVGCVGVVRQLLLRLLYYLLLLMVHAHHSYPYVTTTAPKTTTFLKFCVTYMFCLGYLSQKYFPPKKIKFSRQNCRRRPKKIAAGRRPANKMPAGGKPPVRNPACHCSAGGVLCHCGSLPKTDLLLCTKMHTWDQVCQIQKRKKKLLYVIPLTIR